MTSGFDIDMTYLAQQKIIFQDKIKYFKTTDENLSEIYRLRQIKQLEDNIRSIQQEVLKLRQQYLFP